eukprot:CAMPEP_0202979112 /NCGR_PEP_ID=MMETSP1396-20130829/85351_1 /ASSEMBLY_ACC=CAM_ASM_000872 /TAXON_ID= /ORGANISM="Pseudokeronopsis sp., Strain Brazil" /LENGTH=51 /DNA_ID=CAMNT_0049718391 /DNA_START=1813 /DNA_END=1965 /DNA_ORIENTATION=-
MDDRAEGFEENEEELEDDNDMKGMLKVSRREGKMGAFTGADEGFYEEIRRQ